KNDPKNTIVLSPESSITDSAIDINRSTLSFLSINQNVATSFKTEFNWSRIQSIYLGCNSSLDDDINLSLPMVKTVEKVFDVLEENFIATCKQIYCSVTFLGKKFMRKFDECCALSENEIKINTRSGRMLAHVVSYLKLHRLLLFAFESNVNEAREILNLIALSHLVMNVSPSEFRLLDIALEKYLLKFKVVDDNTLKVAVSYFNLITNYICNYIEQNKDHYLVNQMISTETEEINKRRENLRQLRKWKKLVMKLRHETCIYIEEILGMNDLTKDDSEEESKVFKFNTQCPLATSRSIYNINFNNM
ncbi:hypothetical protein AMK59_6241, partial [Oryctes borbonicus]